MLCHQEAVSLLESTLNEEKKADRKLNDIAESSANVQAAGGAPAKRRAGSSRSE